MEAKYKIKAMPTEGKTWNEAKDIDVTLTLEAGKELRSFKGIVTLFGIVKR